MMEVRFRYDFRLHSAKNWSQHSKDTGLVCIFMCRRKAKDGLLSV